MNSKKVFLLLSFSIFFVSIVKAQTRAEIAASVVSNFPFLNADLAVFFKAESSGECYKLAGYTSTLKSEQQAYFALVAKYENDRCFQRLKEFSEKERTAFKSISADFSAAATEDSKQLRKSLSMYSSLEKEFKSSEEAVDVLSPIRTFASVQAKVNSCASNSFKRLVRIIIKRRNIIYSKLANLNSDCTLTAVGNLTGASVYTGCKISLDTDIN